MLSEFCGLLKITKTEEQEMVSHLNSKISYFGFQNTHFFRMGTDET